MRELNEWDSFYKEFEENRKIAARESAKAARNRAKLKRNRGERLKLRIKREADKEAGRAAKQALREAKQKKIDDCSESIIVLALTTPMDAGAMSELFGIEKYKVHEILNANLSPEELRLRAQITRSKPKPKMMKYTDDDIVNAIKMASEELGPKFGAAKYKNWRKSKPKHIREKIPCIALFQRRGGWRKYREMAGLETPHMNTGMQIERFGVNTYTDEDIFRTLDGLVKKKGEWITIEEVEKMTKDKPKIPKVGIMRIRFGSWENVRKAYFEWLSEQ